MKTDMAEREVVDETVNAYEVEKLSDGSVRLKSGGRVVVRPTYFEALQRYAQWMQEHIEDLPEHLREDRLEWISDGGNPHEEMTE